jgi:kynurenine formamidase
MKIIDLTHTFTDNMPVYPGDPESSLKQTAHIEKDTYNDHQLSTLMHVGTHMDAPLHMIPNGKTMDQIDPERFFGKGVLINAKGKSKIDEELVEDISIPDNSIVIVYTGFSEQYRTASYYENIPFMTEEFANKMLEHKVKIVGMDILGPDKDQPWPTHKILLGNEILIIENLTNLDKLEEVSNFEVIALPAKLQADAAPVRVIAKIQD